ncbi:MAG: COX15/CtaA family protein [Wenzhouxiangellaceae bacterium]
MTRSNYLNLVRLTAALVFVLIILGAWVRLSDAGLGCPDWPGCYGHLTWPSADTDINNANQAYPHMPVDSSKAMKEMVHRYVAGPVGLLIVALAILAWRRRRDDATQPVWIPTLLVPLVGAQALLGMWTVTLLVKPAIVTLHLAGGLTTFALLIWLLRDVARRPPQALTRLSRYWLWLAAVVLVAQILLGGWTSTNYAALACPDFPTCMNQWWPATDFKEAFVLWREVGVNYEGGILDQPARTAIHLSHRLGAIVALLVIGGLALRLWRYEQSPMYSLVLLGLLLTQIVLGVLNVVLQLPLINAVAHNGGAALLLGWMIVLFHHFRRTP